MIRRLLVAAAVVGAVLCAPAIASASLPATSTCWVLNEYPLNPASQTGLTWSGRSVFDYPAKIGGKWVYLPAGIAYGMTSDRTTNGADLPVFAGIWSANFSGAPVEVPSVNGTKRVYFFKNTGVTYCTNSAGHDVAPVFGNNLNMGVYAGGVNRAQGVGGGASPAAWYCGGATGSGATCSHPSVPLPGGAKTFIGAEITILGLWNNGGTIRWKIMQLGVGNNATLGSGQRSYVATGTGSGGNTVSMGFPTSLQHYNPSTGNYDSASLTGVQIGGNWYWYGGYSTDPALFDEFWDGGSTVIEQTDWADTLPLSSVAGTGGWTDYFGGEESGGGSIEVTIGVPPSADDSETADLNTQLDGGGGNWVSNWIWGKITGWLSPITGAWFWFLSLFNGL